jgi:hypothetical protein
MRRRKHSLAVKGECSWLTPPSPVAVGFGLRLGGIYGAPIYTQARGVCACCSRRALHLGAGDVIAAGGDTVEFESLCSMKDV